MALRSPDPNRGLVSGQSITIKNVVCWIRSTTKQKHTLTYNNANRTF